MSEDEESVDLTPGVVWAESQLAVLRQLARHDAELRAENARLREVVRRVEGLCRVWETVAQPPTPGTKVYALRLALGSTDTGPAPAGASAATQGAGDGV